MKEDLLKQVSELGYDPSTGRKRRSDIGKPRHNVKPRSDKGVTRDKYVTDTASYNKGLFQRTLVAARNPDGDGDSLIRDANMIFPPNITNFYKEVKVTNPNKETYSYRSSVRRANHPEEQRWSWWFKELREANSNAAKQRWVDKICKWYFIRPEDIDLWTYGEWAWCYFNVIAGHFNRGP